MTERNELSKGKLILQNPVDLYTEIFIPPNQFPGNTQKCQICGTLMPDKRESSVNLWGGNKNTRPRTMLWCEKFMENKHGTVTFVKR